MLRITLASARINANLTQNEVADKLGVNQSTIVNWEKGRTYPNADMLYRLSALYDMPVENIALNSTICRK